MTGSTAVASTYTYLILTKFYISTAAVGTVTLREDSGSGTVLSTIPIGATYARYRRIAFAPPPAAAITYYIDCERLVTDLVNDTDEPLVPQRFHRLLAIGARAKEYEKQNQVGRSQLAKQEYDKELKKLKFWVYESTVGTPNMRGTGYTRTALSDGGTLAVASSSAASPLAVTSGGTGFASYAIGDLLYADTATTLAKLPDVATGKVLRSGGVGVAPAYGQVTLTTDVTGTLPVANGGTGIATLTANRVPFGNGTSAFQSNANFTFDGTTFTTTGQIAFPATQAPSSGVNTLDDYEEGTWTPVLGGSGGTSGQTYTTQTGNYVKIGKQVFAHFEVLLSAKGTITTNVQIQGLPFTSATGTGIGAGAVGYWTTTATNWIALSLVVTSASTVATVFGISATGTAGPINLVTADIANTTRIIGTLSYMASA
jgi:hypothetical protein